MKKLLLTLFTLASLFSFSQKPGADTVFYHYQFSNDTSWSGYRENIEYGRFAFQPDFDSIPAQYIDITITIQYELDSLCNVSNAKLIKQSKYPYIDRNLLNEFLTFTHIETVNGFRPTGCLTAADKKVFTVPIKFILK